MLEGYKVEITSRVVPLYPLITETLINAFKDAFDGPNNLDKTLKEIEEAHIGEKLKLESDLKKEKTSFMFEVDKLKEDMTLYDNLNDLRNYSSLNASVLEFNEKVKAAEERGNLINIREMKLNGTSTAFDELKTVRETIEYYQNLKEIDILMFNLIGWYILFSI